jgi:hypothetical protein
VIENRDKVDRRLGRKAAKVAMQRSKELLKQIETNKAGR